MAEAAPVAPAAPAAAPAEPTTPPGDTAKPAGDAPAAPASAGSVPEAGSGPGSAAKRLFKLTVDGKAEDYDASDDARVTADLQRGRHWEKRGQELQRKWSEFEKIMASAQQNPTAGLREVAKMLGLDPARASQDMVAEELRRQIREDELSQMSPEQRQDFQDREELARLRAADKERTEREKADVEKAALDKKTAAIAANLDKAIEYGLKDTPLAGDPYAQFMFAASVQGAVEDLLAGRIQEMPHPRVIAGYVLRNIQRLSGKFGTAPAPVVPPSAPPKHPAAKHTRPPGKPTQARDAKTGQFAGGFNYGTTIYERLAEQAEKNPRSLHFNPVPKTLP